MALEKREPGYWALVCDSCSEVITLDCDPDDDIVAAAMEARTAHGYRIFQENHQYQYHYDSFIDKAKYAPEWRHLCPDCKKERRQQVTLDKIRNDTNVTIVEDSRPYKLGVQARKDGADRDSNPCWGPNTRPKWFKGYDNG